MGIYNSRIVYVNGIKIFFNVINKDGNCFLFVCFNNGNIIILIVLIKVKNIFDKFKVKDNLLKVLIV